jgi:hypothetical protein
MAALQAPCRTNRGQSWWPEFPAPKLEVPGSDLMSISGVRGIQNCCPGQGLGHGAGLGGTHEHRIWRRRDRRPRYWGLCGRLYLCLSRGSSGRGGREASKTPAGSEGRKAEATWPDRGLRAVVPRGRGRLSQATSCGFRAGCSSGLKPRRWWVRRITSCRGSTRMNSHKNARTTPFGRAVMCAVCSRRDGA